MRNWQSLIFWSVMVLALFFAFYAGTIHGGHVVFMKFMEQRSQERTMERELAEFSRNGGCSSCLRPWRVLDKHYTPFTPERACFPLCETCWQSMTPQERLPHYRMLWNLWGDSTDEIGVSREEFEKACLQEGMISFPETELRASEVKDVVVPSNSTLNVKPDEADRRILDGHST